MWSKALFLVLAILASFSRGQDVKSFFKEYFQWQLEHDPLNAYIAGIQTEDLRLSNFSLKSYDNYFSSAKNLRKKAELLKNPEDDGEKVYLDMLKYDLDMLIKHYHLKGFLLAPVAFFGGVQVTIPNFFMNNNVFR